MMLDERKAAMRLEMRARRKAIPWDRREDAAEVAWRIYMEEGLPTAGVIALYVRHRFEIDPDPLAAWLESQGAAIALPINDTTDFGVAFGEAERNAQCIPPLGLKPGGAFRQPDVIVTPLIAFDRHGGRLGQGRGFYDRAIAAQRARARRPLVIGLAYQCQEVPSIPMDEFDQRLDGVLTEKAYLPFA